ncbi:MAG: hypothetical protein GX339_10190 [Tissierellia bacterium]|nr:hypothetical protein [Tissierellia bacterium]
MYKLYSKITEPNIAEMIEKKIKFDILDKNTSYTIHTEFYNFDLAEDLLNNDAAYEIKREHYLFIKNVRNMFEKNGITINEFYLMGTIVDLEENEINISLLKSNEEKKKNIVWPSKEIFLFEDRKRKLDLLLFNNQITEEDYEFNLEFLKDELNILENDDEHKYLN